MTPNTFLFIELIQNPTWEENMKIALELCPVYFSLFIQANFKMNQVQNLVSKTAYIIKILQAKSQRPKMRFYVAETQMFL